MRIKHWTNHSDLFENIYLIKFLKFLFYHEKNNNIYN